MSLQESLKPRPRPVYQLVHEARPHREGALSIVMEACRPLIGLPAFNHGVSRAGEGDPIGAARTLPMMAEVRLVVVQGLEDADDRFCESLLDYLKDPSPSTVLVLVGERFRATGKRYGPPIEKAVKAAGGWLLDRKFTLDPARFAMDRAQSLGRTLDLATARFLVEVVGPDLGLLQQEVDKLITFAGDAPSIGSADVEAVCAMVSEAAVWDLTSALIQRNRADVLAQLRRLSSEGNDPRRLLSMVTWKMRGVCAAADLLAQGVSESEAGRAAKLKSNEIRALKPMLKAGIAPADILLGLANANKDMNSHRAGAERVLERLLLDWVA